MVRFVILVSLLMAGLANRQFASSELIGQKLNFHACNLYFFNSQGYIVPHCQI